MYYTIKSNNLNALMKQQNISAAQLADMVRVHVKTIYNVINNQNAASIELAVSIARALSINIEDLFDFVPEKQHENK